MIHLKFNVENPWSDRWNILWCKSGMIGANHAWEFNGYATNHMAYLDFRLRVQGDHPGMLFMLGLLGYNIELNLYDTRHRAC